MKSTFLLFVFAIFFIKSYSQTKDFSTFSLGVEKEYSTYKKAFVFKPYKTLTIKTLDKTKYASDKYSFSDNYIVMDMKDTILFENITWIKGRVYGDKGRKITGAVITPFTALFGPGTIMAVGQGVGGGPAIIVAVLVTGTIYGGFALMGPRKFRRTQDCYVKIIEQQKP